MRTLVCKVFLLLCLSEFAEAEVINGAAIEVLFTGSANISDKICRALDSNPKTISILASKFTSRKIEACINRAAVSGSRIDLIVDFDNSKVSMDILQALVQAGVCVYLDNAHKTAHNKILVLDPHIVITGSYNFTDDSERKNSENSIIIYNKQVFDAYTIEFNKHLKHAKVASYKFRQADRCY